MARCSFSLLLLLLAAVSTATESVLLPLVLPGMDIDVSIGLAPSGLVSFTGGKGSYKSMAREFLEGHNRVRLAHGEAPFKWDKKLARFARRWTDGLRDECAMVHSGGPYGENMFWGTGWDWRASDAVSNWARERHYYNRTDNTCRPNRMCGHFTQMVWNATARLGCARAECYAGGVIISCNYDPPGNYQFESPFQQLEN